MTGFKGVPFLPYRSDQTADNNLNFYHLLRSLFRKHLIFHFPKRAAQRLILRTGIVEALPTDANLTGQF